VGGVVNIITRKGMEGVEVNVQGKSNVSKSGSVNLAMGSSNDTMTVNLYATYYHQDRAYHSDFDWHLKRLGQFSSSAGSPGNYRLALLDEMGNFIRATGNTVADPDCEAALGILASNGRCRYSLWGRTSPITEENRLQAFAEGEIKISDTAEIYAEFHYSNNEVIRVFGPNNPANGKAGGSLLIPADHPFNFWVSNGSGGIQYIDPADWDNSIHQAVPIVYLGRPLGAEFHGPATGCPDCKEVNLEFHTNYFRAMVGGRKDFGDWSADLSYAYNRTERTFINAFQFVGSALNEAIEDGSFNPFGTRVANPTLVSPKDGVTTAGFTQAIWDKFHHRGRDYSTATQGVVDLVVTGPMGSLQGGDIGVAIGAQLRKEDFELLRDPLAAAGLASRPDKEDPEVTGSQNVKAVFAEVLLPITDDLEVSAALRYEDYGGDIGSTTDPKVTVHWQMIDPLAIRASYGTSFQAPTTFQTSESQGSEFLNDPASVNDQGQVVCKDIGLVNNATIFVGGDDGLKPQTSENINLGLIFSPTKSLRVSMDLWHFTYTDLIRPNASAQALVDNDCRDDGIPNDPRIVRAITGALSRVYLSFINTGELTTSGVDLHGVYAFPTTSIGDFSLDGALSYVSKFEITNEDGSKTDGAGSRNFGNPFPSVPELRANLRMAWALGPHNAFAAVRYIDGYLNDQPVDPIPIDSWTALDLRYAYNLDRFFGGTAVFAVGANNVFDNDPPSLGDGQRPGYDDQVADIRGRTIYGEVTVSF
jgi:iron complex outermembrane receptor protein